MATDNVKFGSSPGPYKAIEPTKIPIKLFHTGLNLADGPKDIEDTESTDMDTVRIDRGGVGPDHLPTPFGVISSVPAPTVLSDSFTDVDGTQLHLHPAVGFNYVRNLTRGSNHHYTIQTNRVQGIDIFGVAYPVYDSDVEIPTIVLHAELDVFLNTVHSGNRPGQGFRVRSNGAHQGIVVGINDFAVGQAKLFFFGIDDTGSTIQFWADVFLIDPCIRGHVYHISLDIDSLNIARVSLDGVVVLTRDASLFPSGVGNSKVGLEGASFETDMYADNFLVSYASERIVAPIIHVANFESLFGQKIGVRMKAKSWERYNGATWNVIPGVVPGIQNQRLYTTSMDGLLIAANGSSRLLSWDGHPAHEVEYLSDEAPRAYFVVRIGDRLLAAKIRTNSAMDFNPDQVSWSARRNIKEWSNSLLGAGAAELKPDGKSAGSNYISGLSTIERGALVYRERSLVLGSLTGVGSAPFRFATIDFAHGTESPYSIANGGLALGDFFLGFDYVVYHFDGASPPVPIGLPIASRLEKTVTDLSDCVGFIDPITMNYWLLVPTQENNRPYLDAAYIFNIKEYIRKQKLTWSYRSLTIPSDELAKVSVMGSPDRMPLNYIPVVDDYTANPADIVNNNNALVDALRQRFGGMTLFGTGFGDTYLYDRTKFQADGTWLSKAFGPDFDDFTVDRVKLVASSKEVCHVGVAITWDGGLTFTDEIVIRLEPSNNGTFTGSGWNVSTGQTFQVRLRMINGDCIVHEIDIYGQPRGRSA